MSSKFDYELISSTYTWENCDFTLLTLHLNISEVLVYLDSIFVEREPSKFIEMRPRAKYSLFEVEYAILDDWKGNQVVYAKYQSILYAWMLWFMVKPFIYLENDEFVEGSAPAAGKRQRSWRSAFIWDLQPLKRKEAQGRKDVEVALSSAWVWWPPAPASGNPRSRACITPEWVTRIAGCAVGNSDTEILP
jgi:hypothetical protein